MVGGHDLNIDDVGIFIDTEDIGGKMGIGIIAEDEAIGVAAK